MTTGRATKRPISAWGTVLALLAIYILSYIDRQTLSIVVDPIRTDLRLSDTQIGLLQGFLFTTVLVLCSIPMAIMADRSHRIRLVLVCMAIWSIATIGCGFATSFEELAAARIGLAIAESVVPAASMSLIGDLFTRREAARSIAVFLSGSTAGSGLALLLGGPLVTFLDQSLSERSLFGITEAWRALFILIGCATLILAGIFSLILREPPRHAFDAPPDSPVDFWPFFRSRLHFLAPYIVFASAQAMSGYCLYAWTATILIRVHKVSAATTGAVIGPLFLVTTLSGAMLSAWLVGRGDPRRPVKNTLRVMLVAMALLLCQVIFLPAFGFTGTVIVLGGILLAYSVANVSFLTPVQLVTPGTLRARMAAVTSTFCVIPAGLGPVLVGVLTDRVFRDPAALDRATAVVIGTVCIVGLAGGLAAFRISSRLEGGQVRA